MNKIFTTIIISLFISNAFGQINMKDSTAQVIGYWNIGDKQSYNVSLQKIKLRETDTISNELMTYNVDVTVIDSTANSYSIEWFYHNYKTNSTNEIVKKVTSLSEDLKVIIETDEFGARKGKATSRFSQSNSSISKIKNLTNEAITKGKHSGTKGNYSITHTFDDIIGTTSNGKKTKSIQIYLDKVGNVLNSYPIPNPVKK
ncbi:MAG TPA: hypothetical protein DEO36_00800 [Flavobacteriaceae bacterium]|nr:hypothetical protein [Flavobacteriaceae bacterium]